MKSGQVDAVVVGADRIAANETLPTNWYLYGCGIGPETRHSVLTVAAPITTLDFSLKTGEIDTIEERDRKRSTPYPGASDSPPRASMSKSGIRRDPQ